MATLSALKQQYTNKTGVSRLLTQNQQQTVATHLQEEEEARRNQGGFFGGIGYSLEKLGWGFLSSIEGIWDYTAGGLAKLFGADDWAEQQFANDWVNYNHADEWFNPSEGWQFVGDVTGGIGTSLPAIATVVAAGAIAGASCGTLTPVAAALISGAVAGLGAAGNATKQAYRETGELGGKEFGYGALVGVTEGAVEGLSAGIGVGTGQIVKGISKSFGKEVAETVTRQTIGKAMIKGFIGEAFEEGLSEILDPVWARLTYDPNAKNATLQEVGYAALVGGLSGAIMGGVYVSIRNVHSMSRGSTIVKEGKSSNVISMAEQLSAYESQNHTGYEQFATVDSVLKELQTSMQKTNGEIRTAKQRMLLGVLERANTTAAFTPFVARSAENIVNNAEVIAEKLTAYGIKDAQGNPVTFTAEQIRSGVDTNNASTFVNALKTNSVLRSLAVADATGRLSMDTAKFKEATLRGQQLSSQADLNQFIENATDAERQAVSERLGIDDWNTLTNEQFQQKIVEFSQNGGVEAYQQEQATVRELQNIDPATAKKMPARLNLKKDGTVRYTNGAVNIAVTKNGDTYRIYDYDSGKYSKPLTQAEANRTIREIKKAQAAAPVATPAVTDVEQQGTQQQSALPQQAEQQAATEQGSAVRKVTEQVNSAQQQTQEIDSYARKNIPDYAKLNAPNQGMIRSVIRQGRAAGIADADVLSYARVAAHTGINVVFDKSLCAVAVNNDTGEKIYADGYYDPDNNRFVINPETKRTHEALLLHEMTHAIYRTADGKLILERGVKNMSQAEKDAIIKRYSDVGHGGAIELKDEINARYAEGMLTNKNTVERLVAEKPKLKDRILSFFKKSSTAYEGDVKLTKAANSLYKRYQKLFDSFSERNSQYNAAEYRHVAPNAETRLALQESFDRLGKYTDDEIRSIETSKLYQVARSYDDVKTFITRSLNTATEKRLFLGKITAETAAKIKTETDIDADGKSIALSSSDIKHIFKNHGTDAAESMRGQIPITEANFENIIETLIEPETVTRSDENGRVGIVFKKEIDGKVTAITIMSEKKKALTLKSAWITKEKQSTTPTSNVQALNLTSETGGRIKTAFDNSISENGKKVNRNGKKRFALPVNEFENTLDNLDSFNSVDEIKSYFADVHAMINDEYYGSPHTMAEHNEQIRKRAEKVMRAVNLEKEAIKQYRKTHTPKNTIDLETKAQIEAIDAQYQKAIKDNDLETAKLLVEQMAIQKGYSVTDYRIDHKAPCADGSNASLDDVTSMFGEDIYGDNAARYFGTYEGFDNESIRHIQQAKGKPKGFVMAYRAVPVSVKSNQIRNGDWITLTYQYAVNHGESNIIGKYRVISKKVRISDVYTNGDSIHEFGYDDGKQYYYRDTVNYRKLADTITFDDEGNPIRLKDRFNYRNSDIRYALSPMSEEQYRFVSKLSMIEATQTENNRYSVYCENNSGLLEYEASGLNYEKLAKYFGDELAVDITYRASEVGKTVKILSDTLSPFVEKYKTLSNITPDIYKVAKKKFGTTNNAQVAGYINLDGTMLDFSGGYDYRLHDHRDISDIMSNLSGTQAMNAYIAQGNIRIMPEAPSLEMDAKHEPTEKQYKTMRNVIDELLGGLDAGGRFDIEFSDGGDYIESRGYTQADSTAKVLADIRYFYKRGALPVQSELSKFRYTLPETDSDGRRLTEQQRKYFQNSKIVDESGKLLVLYHQTDSNFTEFDTSIKGAGQHDYLTPFGIFMKPTAKNIGIKGNVQMPLYGNVTNPIEFADRNALEQHLREVAHLGEQIDAIKNLDAEYQAKFDTAEKQYTEIATKAYYDAENKTLQSQLTEAEKRWNGILDEWGSAFDKRSAALKEVVNQYFRNTQYDGIILRKDGGSFGRETAAYIAFEPNQVKNTTNIAPTKSRDIRYSLPPVEPVKPSSKEWNPTIDTQEAKRRFPNLWDIQQDSSETRNPTQIKGTVSTYRKIYEFLKKEGFNGRILDASSGLGYGTQAGISEFGFDVEDIEPYPDSKYKPKYTDYSALDEKYDVIISNAVLNVLPQDQRDALVVKMGELLNVGGRLFVNVRGDDVNNLSSNPNNVKIGEMEWYVAPTGSYQKGFTRAELVAYLKDALGNNFKVEPTTLFGKSSAIVTKISDDNIKYSLKGKDTQYLTAIQNNDTEKARKILLDFARNAGYTDLVYHGTQEYGFTELDTSRSDDTISFFVTSSVDTAKTYSGVGGVKEIKSYQNAPKKVSESTSDSELVEAAEREGYRGLRRMTDSDIHNELASDMGGRTYINTCLCAEDLVETVYLVMPDLLDDYAPHESPVWYTQELFKIAKDVYDLKKSYKNPKTVSKWLELAERASKIKRAELLRLGDDFENIAANFLFYLKYIKEYYQDGGFVSDEISPIRKSYLIEKINDSIDYEYGRGNYQLFAKPSNQLVIDGQGANWNFIPISKEMAKDLGNAEYYYTASTRKIAQWAHEHGYSSVKFKNISDNGGHSESAAPSDVIAYFDGTLLKSADTVVYDDDGKIIPLTERFDTSKSDIRYSLPDDENNSRGGLTRGQRAKFVANNTQMRVYSKAEAADIINAIIDERLVFGDKYGSLSGKSRAEVIETLFTKLNNTSEGYRIGVALDIADYIINNAVLTDMYDSYDDVSYAMETLSVIRRYMHKVDLRGIKGEIQHKFDKKNAVSLVWGAKQGGMAPDVIAQELQSYGINIEAINEADQFLEMLEIYEKAKNDVTKKADKLKLTAYGSKEQIGKLRQQIARDILNAYDEKGAQSKYGKLVEKYTNQIASLTKQVKQARKINSITNSLIDSAQYLRDIAAKRNYVGAEVFTAPELTSWLKQLGKLKYRSDLRKSGARKILLDYGKFYNTNNPLLYDADPNLTYIDQNVLDALNFIKENESSTKPLSLEELQAAQVIMASAKHLFQNYDQMTMEGKKVRISEAAAAGNEIIRKTKNRVGRGFFNNIYGIFNKIVEPRVVIKSLENYDPNGILTRAYNEITRGETAASLQYIQLVEKFDDYFKQNKKYRKRLTSEYITVAGAELNVGQALSLYELSKREQAKDGLYESGFSYTDKKGVKQTVKITESDIEQLQSTFTESDKQFIAIVEDFFNVQSKKVKTAADLQILGYTNASDDFYFPIQRDKGTIAKNITDARDLMADWANVYNFSFNKDVKTGAKNKIFVPEIWSVITRHAKQLSTYAHLTVPLKNFSQIYSKNIGTKTDVRSIRNTLNEQVWGGADSYLSKLFSDIQGKATSSSVIEKLRGAYAKYQLGANLKVIVSQITSYPTAGIELDFRSMVKGAVMKTDYAAMDKYCDYARVRNYEKGVVRAEGVIDKVGKVGDVLTKPIQWTDRATIGKLWNACQVQVQRDSGLKVGTVENMEKAGVMLEEVVRLTQPNYTNTERSALMRSDSDIVRSFTMFTSVPLKQLSRLVESVGEYKALRQMIKAGDTNADVQARYKKAKKRLRRTLASITVANLMYTMVSQFFKWLYDKDREDKDGNEISFVQDFFTDFASTTIGMFPVVKDIYNYFANDYEFSNFAYDSINSILSTTKDLFEVATKAAGGESLETSDYMKPLRNSLYAIGQITGLPFRNINNMVSGLIKRFDPATAYKYNSIFYNARYSNDIKKALAKGDTELADTIMGLMLDEDKAGNLNTAARKKLLYLYEKEYDVLPRSVGDSISYNGETIKLTAQQRTRFKTIYGQANGYVECMIQNKAFGKLSDEKQAKAIKQVYDAYYDKALAETLGVSSNNKLLLLSKFMGIESLSIALAGISDITSDKDKNGATVQGSKKKKVIQYLLGLNFTDAQRLLILFMQGYKIGDGEYKRLTADRAKRMVISYILSLNKATQAEKAQLAQMCGVEVKNGRIVTKSLYAAK